MLETPDAILSNLFFSALYAQLGSLSAIERATGVNASTVSDHLRGASSRLSDVNTQRIVSYFQGQAAPLQERLLHLTGVVNLPDQKGSLGYARYLNRHPEIRDRRIQEASDMISEANIAAADWARNGQYGGNV